MPDEKEYFRSFQKLKSTESLAGLDNASALDYLACLVDLAAHYDDGSSIDKALRWAEELQARALNPTERL
jgi:hypothetical protein